MRSETECATVTSSWEPPTGWLRRLSGALFLFFFSLTAWLFTLAPVNLPFAEVAGFAVGLLLFVPGYLLAAKAIPPGKTLVGGGMAFLFFNAAFLPERFLLVSGPGIASALLVCFLFLSWRLSSQSLCVLTFFLAAYHLYLLRHIPPPPLWSVILVCWFGAIAAWLTLWLATRPTSAFPECVVPIYYGILYLASHQFLAEGQASAWQVVLPFLCIHLAFTGAVVLSWRIALLPSLPRSTFVVIEACSLLAFCWLLTRDAARTFQMASLGVAVVSFMAGQVLNRRVASASRANLHFLVGAGALTAAITSFVPPELRSLALAGLCLLPALLGYRRRDTLFQKTEMLFLLCVLAASFSPSPSAPPVYLGMANIPPYWLGLFGTVAILCMTARLHTSWSHTSRAHRATYEPMALAHGCSAALLLSVHTILYQGDSGVLPAFLGMQGTLFLGLGMLLSTPALALASLTPIMAGYVSALALTFAGFATVGPDKGILSQLPWLWIIPALAVAVANDYLRIRDEDLSHGPSVRALSLLPCFLVVSSLPVLWADHPPIPGLPVLCNIAAIVVLVFRRNCLWLSGLTFTLIASGLIAALLDLLNNTPSYNHPHHLPLLALYLFTLVIIERLLSRPSDTPGSRPLSLTLCCIMVAAGTFALYRWNSGPLLALPLIGLACGTLLIGIAARERAYLIAALLFITIASLHLVTLFLI